MSTVNPGSIPMLSDVVLSPDGKKPQRITFEGMFVYRGKKNFRKMKSLQAVADTSFGSLSFLSDLFAGLQILRLNESILPSIRDIGTELSSLRILSLENCYLTSLDGINAVSPKIQELYVGFNQITDISELVGLTKLKILNIESNNLESIEDIQLLACCPSFRRLYLRGNGVENTDDYRNAVKVSIPQLTHLDGVKFGCEEEVPPPPAEPVETPPPETQIRPFTSLPPIMLEPGSLSPRPRQTILKGAQITRPTGGRRVWYNIGPIKL
jgi:Leucine-rich repeat (LRR) protein